MTDFDCHAELGEAERQRDRDNGLYSFETFMYNVYC